MYLNQPTKDDMLLFIKATTNVDFLRQCLQTLNARVADTRATEGNPDDAHMARPHIATQS